jgi:hypothetical protein
MVTKEEVDKAKAAEAAATDVKAIAAGDAAWAAFERYMKLKEEYEL